MTTRTWRTAAFAAAAGVSVLVALTGCAPTGGVRAEPSTGGSTSATSTPDGTATTEASGASSPSTGTATTSPGTGSSTGDGDSAGSGSLRSGQCAATGLAGSVTAAAGGGSAGHQEYEIVFRNTGSSPCTLQGWPGVSFVGDGNGTQLGAPAVLDRSSAHGTVTIAAGSIAHASVLVADAQDYGDCGIATANGFRVYPPGSKQSLFVDAGALQLSACTDPKVQQLQVQAVQPGS